MLSHGVNSLAFRGGIRMVTHNDISPEDVQTALAALQSVGSANGHTNGSSQNGHAAHELKAY